MNIGVEYTGKNEQRSEENDRQGNKGLGGDAKAASPEALETIRQSREEGELKKRLGEWGSRVQASRETWRKISESLDIEMQPRQHNTTLVYAKADIRLLRDAIQSLDALGRNGYKMVTKGMRGEQKLLEGKTSIVCDDTS